MQTAAVDMVAMRILPVGAPSCFVHPPSTDLPIPSLQQANHEWPSVHSMIAQVRLGRRVTPSPLFKYRGLERDVIVCS